MKDYQNTELSPQERAKSLVSEMTPEEKCRQMKYNAPAIPRLGLDSYNWWNEGLHGVARAGTATVFPQSIALAAMFSENYMKKIANVIALEARAKYNAVSIHGDHDIYKGLTLWSPNINIYRDPRWGRGQETFGEDPHLTYRLGKAYVKGIQGNGKYWTAAACLKHFICHSGPEGTRHGFNSVVSPKDFEETYSPHFRKIIKETDVAGVMGAYNALNGQPCCASPTLQKLLRKKWKFKGYFVSDCWAVRDFHEHFMVTDNPIDSAALAVNNGCDLNCGCTYDHLLSAYYKGKVLEDELDKSVERLMVIRYKLGMMDTTPLDDIPYSEVCKPESTQLAYEAALRSMVLLKNDGILPLDENKIKNIAVIGPNADRIEALEGNYCGKAPGYTTFLEGIKQRFSGRVVFAKGCEIVKDRTEPLAQKSDRLSEALAAADISDVVVLCLGLDASIEGEEGDTSNVYASGDKPNLNYPEPQRELMKQILALGKPVILVTAAGGGLNPGTNKFNAEIMAWYSGQEGGRALASILFGDVSPSGKLPITIYKSADMLPPFEDYSMAGRTYRYAEDENILHHFGDGLSFSEVEISIDSWKKDRHGGILTIFAENKGKYDTEEVAEIYIASNSPDAVKNVTLAAFRRFSIKSGEKVKLSIPVSTFAFTVVDDEGNRYIDGDADYKIFAANAYPDMHTEKIQITALDFGKD